MAAADVLVAHAPELDLLEEAALSAADDERRTNAFGLLMSLNMLIEPPGRLRLHRRGLPWLAG